MGKSVRRSKVSGGKDIAFGETAQLGVNPGLIFDF